MKITKKSSLRIIGYQICLLITLVIAQIAIQYAQTHKYVGFVAKDESNWIGIAEVAQADKMSCQQELEQVKAEKAEAIKAGNPDLYAK